MTREINKLKKLTKEFFSDKKTSHVNQSQQRVNIRDGKIVAYKLIVFVKLIKSVISLVFQLH